ncbi:hypothetical protein FRC08_003437 [Ceratobasidium sp. 394]|nr:hypothetical protein FRC08_003437 [Ceratobasidium sp. 394]
MASAQPSSRDVFSIPELAILISSFSTRQTCARLVQTSRLLYSAAVPFVWEHVDDARHLLLLLDEAAEQEKRGEWANEPPDIWLSEAFRVDHPFLRFDFYAPYVKSLDVYGRKEKFFKVFGWKVLISRAQKQLLLPSLHTLAIRTSCGAHGPDQPMWIGAFASPSLVNLRVSFEYIDASNHPTISYPAASMIMKSVVAHHPKLERLGVFPYYEKGMHGEEGESNLLAFLSGNNFYEYVADLTSLREISGTLAWFNDEALLLLGELPHLETLAAYSGDDEAGGDVTFRLPDGSFPSLRHLILHDMHVHDATSVLFYGPPLLRNLTALDVQFYLIGLDDPDQEFDDDEWFNERLIPYLEDTPNLTDLKIVAFPRNKAKNVVCELDEPSLLILSALPLHTLALHYIGFADDISDLELGTIWPGLTRLEMPSCFVSLTDLRHFAAIPSLQYLKLRLDLRNKVVPGLDGPKQSGLTTLASGVRGEICSTFVDIDSVAR